MAFMLRFWNNCLRCMGSIPEIIVFAVCGYCLPTLLLQVKVKDMSVRNKNKTYIDIPARNPTNQINPNP